MACLEVDVAVVGAGPAGVAAARGLAEAGLRVAMIDRGSPPAPRIESLPVAGLAIAESLGLGDALAAASLGRAEAMEMHWRILPERRAFGEDAPFLLDRTRLHPALIDAVLGVRLLRVRAGTVRDRGDRVLIPAGDQTLEARFAIDARGRSGLRAAAEEGPPLVALPFRGWSSPQTLRPVMRLLAGVEGWVWAACLPDGRVDGALFLDPARLAGMRASGRRALVVEALAATPLGGVGRLSVGRAAPARLGSAADPFGSPLVLRVGDALLSHDPLASHGLVHAFRSGAQASAAVATMLDPAGEAAAARAFLRDRHLRAAATARTGTARAYAEQARPGGAFWVGRATPLPAAGPRPWPSLSRPLGLAHPLRRVAVLDAGRIRWAPAIWLAESAEAAPKLGPLSADRLAGLLDPPAPIGALSRRLEGAVGAALGRLILRRLLDEGALVAADGRRGGHPTGARASSA